MPLLHVDTVVDAIVDILDSGLSQTVYLPGIFRYFAGLVSKTDFTWLRKNIYWLKLYSEELRTGFSSWFKAVPSPWEWILKGDRKLIRRLGGLFSDSVYVAGLLSATLGSWPSNQIGTTLYLLGYNIATNGGIRLMHRIPCCYRFLCDRQPINPGLQVGMSPGLGY